MSEPSANPRAESVEHRRSARFPVVVPLEVTWEGPGKETRKETAQATNVNSQGGLLEMRNHPSVGTAVELTNLVSQEKVQARIIAVRRAGHGEAGGVAVELKVPSESFWGINFELKRTSAHLVKIEQALKSGEVDARILSEFRDAIDYVRKTAWAVQEWQERQLRHHDPQTVLPLLTVERIRRATQLSKAIIADLEAKAVSRESVGVEELFQVVQRIHESLARLFENRGAQA